MGQKKNVSKKIGAKSQRLAKKYKKVVLYGLAF
jgi:hypothetical protein